MATLEQLESALVKADAAGNVADAKALADAIRGMRSPPQTIETYDPKNPKNASEAIRAMKEGGFGSGTDGLANEAGGKVVDFTSKFLPPKAAAAAGFATNVGLRAVPALFGGSLAKTAMAPTMESAAKSLMQSAVKPTIKDLQTGKAARAIETLLVEGVNPTQGGMNALRASADELTPVIESAIARSPSTVSKSAVGSRLADTLKTFKSQVNPQTDVQAVRDAWKAFKTHPDLVGKQNIPVALAQSLKQGTYKQLSNKAYGELGGAATEAQKALARGLKEEIALAVPEVAKPLAKQAELFNALNVAERRALLQENVNPGSLAFLAANPKAAAGFLADKSAAVKGILARILYSGREAIPYGVGASAGGILGAMDVPLDNPSTGLLGR